MGAYKDKGGRWYVSVRYKNWLGEPSRKTKRGFTTKRDALAWEREFLQKYSGSLDMTFNSFYEVYQNDLQNRIRQNTWVTKSSIIEKKIMPYFGNKRVRDVKPVDVLHWQNIIMETTDENGMPYSPVYLKTLHNQLSAVFNHAVKFYGLKENPAAKGCITVGFRVSPEEHETINRIVALSGLTKQEYCYRKCTDREIVVEGNPRAYKALKVELAAVLDELKRIESGGNVSGDLLEVIDQINKTLYGLKEGSECPI